MKTIKNTLYLGIVSFGLGLNAIATEKETEYDYLYPWHFSSIARYTDAIVIGSVKSLAGTFLNTYHHIDFYEIHVTDSILAEDTKLILAVYKHRQSSLGSCIRIQPEIEYMFFLKKCDKIFSDLPLKGTVYETVKIWQGIIPFNSNAIENRSASKIKAQYSIDVFKERDSFIEAIQATVAKSTESEIKEATELSEDASALFSRLELTRDFFTPTKNRTNK